MKAFITSLYFILTVISISAQTITLGVGKDYMYGSKNSDHLTSYEIIGNMDNLNVGVKLEFGTKYFQYLPVGEQEADVQRFGYVVSHRYKLFYDNQWKSDLELGWQTNLNAVYGYLEAVDNGIHITYRKYFDTRFGIVLNTRYLVHNYQREILNSDYTGTWFDGFDHLTLGVFYKFPSFEPIQKYDPNPPKKSSLKLGPIW